MVTVSAGQWDETICNMVACQHPPCWEAMRRIESGHPRILLRALDSSEKDSSESEDELPTLKILNLPLNYSQRERFKCVESFGSISKTISSIKDAKSYFSNTTLNDTVMHPISVMSSERNPFPGLNSRMDSQTPHFTPLSFTCLRQAEKIQVTDLGEFAVHRLGYQPAYENLIVRWVPDIRHRHMRLEKPASRGVTPTQRMCVKDLALESMLSFKEKKETKRKRSNKVPTGGQPYLLHLRRSQKIPDSISSLVGKARNPKQSPIQKRPFSPCHMHLAPIIPPQNEGTLYLENRRGVLPENKEKLAPPFTVQKAPSLYRFETKIPMKGRGLRRTPGQLKFALGGSEVFRRPMPSRTEQLNAADAQCHTGGGLPEKSQQPQKASAADDCSPLMLLMTAARRKSSVKFMEYKSNLANVSTEGYDNCIPRMSRTESKYNQYCKQLTGRKEATLAQASDPSAVGREPWPKEAAQNTPEENFLPPLGFTNPPPPPPSPLISESSDNPSLDLTLS
ncbi:uncharacterized protein C9orf43 homolog [Elgaria multicarinata webbii]|uniref:uncharacterized protein C9orf43 homolog n=1 Tax=Elgaria multicarinata webbii TaxID=159646 RepID=UPI002FCD5D51